MFADVKNSVLRFPWKQKITDPKSIVRGNPTTEILENLKAETERAV